MCFAVLNHFLETKKVFLLLVSALKAKLKHFLALFYSAEK